MLRRIIRYVLTAVNPSLGVCVCVPTMLLSCPMTKAVSGGWIYSGLWCEEMQSIMVEFQVLEAVGWGLLVASW